MEHEDNALSRVIDTVDLMYPTAFISYTYDHLEVHTRENYNDGKWKAFFTFLRHLDLGTKNIYIAVRWNDTATDGIIHYERD